MDRPPLTISGGATNLASFSRTIEQLGMNYEANDDESLARQTRELFHEIGVPQHIVTGLDANGRWRLHMVVDEPPANVPMASPVRASALLPALEPDALASAIAESLGLEPTDGRWFAPAGALEVWTREDAVAVAIGPGAAADSEELLRPPRTDRELWLNADGIAAWAGWLLDWFGITLHHDLREPGRQVLEALDTASMSVGARRGDPMAVDIEVTGRVSAINRGFLGEARTAPGPLEHRLPADAAMLFVANVRDITPVQRLLTDSAYRWALANRWHPFLDVLVNALGLVDTLGQQVALAVYADESMNMTFVLAGMTRNPKGATERANMTRANLVSLLKRGDQEVEELRRAGKETDSEVPEWRMDRIKIGALSTEVISLGLPISGTFTRDGVIGTTAFVHRDAVYVAFGTGVAGFVRDVAELSGRKAAPSAATSRASSDPFSVLGGCQICASSSMRSMVRFRIGYRIGKLDAKDLARARQLVETAGSVGEPAAALRLEDGRVRARAEWPERLRNPSPEQKAAWAELLEILGGGQESVTPDWLDLWG